MAAPHNKKRYGETWRQDEIDATFAEMQPILPYVVVSGGWAWHFMAPEGHAELKHAHDHKDADLFVILEECATVMAILKERGFEKARTRHDHKEASKNFTRYVKTVTVDGREFVVIFDLFMERVNAVPARDGVYVVEPTQLLSFYGVKHESIYCFCVQIAKDLLARGLNPVGHPQMGDYSLFLAAE